MGSLQNSTYSIQIQFCDFVICEAKIDKMWKYRRNLYFSQSCSFLTEKIMFDQRQYFFKKVQKASGPEVLVRKLFATKTWSQFWYFKFNWSRFFSDPLKFQKGSLWEYFSDHSKIQMGAVTPAEIFLRTFFNQCFFSEPSNNFLMTFC